MCYQREFHAVVFVAGQRQGTAGSNHDLVFFRPTLDVASDRPERGCSRGGNGSTVRVTHAGHGNAARVASWQRCFASNIVTSPSTLGRSLRDRRRQ
jgi:hypothetical protein